MLVYAFSDTFYRPIFPFENIFYKAVLKQNPITEFLVRLKLKVKLLLLIGEN